jgi:hypothetical protein
MRRCWAMMLVALAASVQATPTADSPAIEYLQKKQQVKETDAAGLKSLGEWAEAHGLSSQAAECYRKSLELGLDDEAVYESLMKIADNTKLPPEPGAEASLKQEFTGRSVHVTSHFLIVYGPDSNWAMNRAVLLERTYDSFYQVMRAASLRPLPLTKRLVCLLFDKYEDYAAYADRTDGLKQQWVAGYYSSRTNRIAFFNDKTNPAFDEVKLRTAALEQQLGKVQAAMNEAVKRKNTGMVGEYR